MKNDVCKNGYVDVLFFFFFRRQTACEVSACLVGSVLCIKDRSDCVPRVRPLVTLAGSVTSMAPAKAGNWGVHYSGAGRR